MERTHSSPGGLAATLLLTVSLLEQTSNHICVNLHFLLISDTVILLSTAIAFPGSVSSPAVPPLVGKAAFSGVSLSAQIWYLVTDIQPSTHVGRKT